MTEAEWLASDDPIAMLAALGFTWHGEPNGLVKLTHRYLLACCREIWPLLPLEASRQGVEITERYIEGRATRDEYANAEFRAEGAAYFLEANDEVSREREEWSPEERECVRRYEADRKARVESLARDVEAIPFAEIRRMVRMIPGADLTPHQLLSDAAYFADFAMVYPGVRPREGAIERYSQFLSAPLLRDFVGRPYRGDWQRHWYSRQARYWR